MHSLHTCPSSRVRWLTCFVALTLGGSACALTGIDPDEIDVANDDEVGQDELGDSGGETGPIDTAGEGTAATGENDQDTSGTDTGAGSTTDDGTTTDPLACEVIGEVVVGDNQVEAPDAASLLEGSCGGVGGESLYSFTATAAGDYTFAVTAGDIPAVIYAVDAQCTPNDGQCALDANGFSVLLATEQTLFIAVDTDGAGGVVTLSISGP